MWWRQKSTKTKKVIVEIKKMLSTTQHNLDERNCPGLNAKKKKIQINDRDRHLKKKLEKKFKHTTKKQTLMKNIIWGCMKYNGIWYTS